MSVRVLLLTPRFYGIEKIIKSVLEEQNYVVTWIENKSLEFDYHGSKAKLRLLRRIFFRIFKPDKRYLKKEFGRIEAAEFDMLLSINAFTVCPYLFRRLKKANPDLYSVLYLWDSSEMYNWTKELKLFDKVYTFDRADSDKYKIEYKPLFFVKSADRCDSEYDLFFAGKFSPDRMALIDNLLAQPETSNIKILVRLYPAFKIFPHIYFIYFLFRKAKLRNNWLRNFLLNFEANEGLLKREYVVHEMLDYTVLQKSLHCSNVILDIPFKHQTGYSHRLIEALATGKKIITTSYNIAKEVFYDPDQIHILDQENPVIDFDWVKTRQTFSKSSYFTDLELSKWLKSILNAETA